MGRSDTFVVGGLRRWGEVVLTAGKLSVGPGRRG